MAVITTYDAVAKWKDLAGNFGTSHINKIPSASTPDTTKLGTLLTAYKVRANAAVYRYNLLKWAQEVFAGATTPIRGLNSIKAAIQLEYEIAGAPVKKMIWLPNPSETIIEGIAGVGQRVTQAALDDLSADLTTMAGFTVTANYGNVMSRSWKRQASPSGTCLVFKDEAQVNGYLTFPSELVTDQAALKTFATAVDDTLSNSLLCNTYFLTVTEVSPTQGSGIGLAIDDATDVCPFSSAKTHMRVKLEYKVSNVRHFMTVSLPGVKRSVCEVAGNYFQLTAAAGALVASETTTFFGSGNRLLSYYGSRTNVKYNG